MSGNGSKPELKLDWCSHEAAKYAVMHWHYSKAMPSGKLVKIGAWEDGEFIGAVLFGRGSNNNIGKPYQLKQIEICELVRVTLDKHRTPTTRIIAIAMRFLRKNSPGLKLIISYADPEHGHHGGIYQGWGWIYVGMSQAQSAVMYRGKPMHKRTAHALFGTIRGMERSPVSWKYKYLYPLNQMMKNRIEPLRKPYPKPASVAQRQSVAPTSAETAVQHRPGRSRLHHA